MKILPDSIKLFIVNRLLEISGVTSILLSIFILVSLVSYSGFDPSIFNLNSYEVKNIGGYVGANISEVLIQFFGYSSILICIVLTSWAYKLFFSKNLELFALNFLLLPFTIYLLALFFERIGLPIHNGFIAYESLVFINETNIISNNYLNFIFLTLIFISFLVSFYFTMGLKLNEWNKIFRVVWKIIQAGILIIIKSLNKAKTKLIKSPAKEASSRRNSDVFVY